jgi:lipopolysaccharide/colanic/teichoic acid biosynthesis glycosyltransferase
VIKRIFDIMLTLIGALFLFPVFLLTALMVKNKLGSLIFFKQVRPGLNGNLFNMYKFRSMTNECDKDGTLLSNKARVCF